MGLGLAWCVISPVAVLHAFPPAPHQTLFGVVRDEQGNPLALPKSSVVLEVPGNPAVTATVRNTTGVDGNYQLTVPMDSGLTAARYKPSALFPAAAFTLKVRIGTVNYVPIEMTGVNGLVAEPGKTARVDLTLGVDSDGDGLPDAWEPEGRPAGRGRRRRRDQQPQGIPGRDVCL